MTDAFSRLLLDDPLEVVPDLTSPKGSFVRCWPHLRTTGPHPHTAVLSQTPTRLESARVDILWSGLKDLDLWFQVFDATEEAMPRMTPEFSFKLLPCRVVLVPKTAVRSGTLATIASLGVQDGRVVRYVTFGEFILQRGLAFGLSMDAQTYAPLEDLDLAPRVWFRFETTASVGV